MERSRWLSFKLSFTQFTCVQLITSVNGLAYIITMSEQQEAETVGVFNRLFNAAARARQVLAASNEDSRLLSSTRRRFRRQVPGVLGGSAGRRENLIWQATLFLLPGPLLVDFLPPGKRLNELAKLGLGKPVQDPADSRTNSKIGLNWSLAELDSFVCQSYPLISLNLVGFELARAGKRRKIRILHVSSVRELKTAVGKSRLYIVPRAPVMQETLPPLAMSQNSLPPLSAAPAADETSQVAMENAVSDQVASTSSAISMDAFTPLSIAPVQDEIAPVAESTQTQSVVANQALQEWRAIRTQQDQEYNQSLLVDQEKERIKLAYQACEERCEKAIDARRQRLSACVAPSDGVLIKFKYPDGHINMRKFSLSDPVQTLFDFVGQDDVASEIFVVQEATSSRSLESTSAGSINDHGIKPSSTLYVLWFSNQHVQEILSDQKHDGAPGQSSLSEPSTQPSLSVPSLQSGPATHSLLSEPPLQPLPSENSIQPLLTLFSQPEIRTEEPSLTPSPSQEPFIHLGGPVDEIDLQTILKKLASKVDESFCSTSNQINVCRDNVLQCSLRAFKRKSFDPEAKLDVVFVDENDNGEGAVDEGGPTREYLRLLMRAVHQSNIFDGHEKDRQLRLDTQALQSQLYTWVGKMISVCIVHGGVAPHFFSERLFRQICGQETTQATVDEVGDHTFREQLMKIQEATTVAEANDAITEAADSLGVLGALRYASSLEEKDSLVQSASDFFVNGRLATALDQFADGLKTLGLLEEMRQHPEVFYNSFVNEEIPLQAKDLCKLFVPHFSVQGSNRRNHENATICFWRDFLIDVEEGECSPVTLERVLEFASGASKVPPLGFPHPPQIQFIHDENRIFPEANTCIVILHLPLHSSYECFTKHMMEGILQAPTFGLA